MRVAQRRHPMLRKFICRRANAPWASNSSLLRVRKIVADKNSLLDAVRGDIPSSIRAYSYGNFILAAVAAVKRRATSS